MKKADATRVALEEEELRKALLEEGIIEEALRQKKVYESGVTEYYDTLRKETEEKRARKLIDDREKIKIVQLRRQREWDQWRKDKKEQEQRKIQKDQSRLDEWNAEWEKVVEVRVADRGSTTTRLLKAPDGEHERKEKSRIVGLINSRKKVRNAKCPCVGSHLYRLFPKDTRSRELKWRIIS